MIHHALDWSRYPDAIIDTKTENSSFLHYTKTLKTMGIENHAWPLSLMNPALQGLDPFSPKLTVEEIAGISYESKFNYWYFLREVSRVPQTGSPKPSMYLANRANMAFNWCFLNNIDFANIMPRQCGKSVGADVINNWMINVSGRNTKIQLLTRGDDLRVKNIKTLKEIRSLLPDYLNFFQPGIDTNNNERMTCVALKNEYVTSVAQKDRAAADNVGRGLTGAIIQVDEAPYCSNIQISLPVALGSTTTARDQAEANGAFYGNIYTTTAGKKDTKEGKFMYDLIHSGMYWREALLDAGSREQAWEMIGRHSNRRLVNGTFSHRQVGKSDEWMREKILASASDKDGAERDYLNVWTSGSESSPLSVSLNQAIAKSEEEPSFSHAFKGKYVIDWFIAPEDIQVRMTRGNVVLSLDSSDAAGMDGNGLVIMDLRNMEVLGSVDIKEASLMELGKWLADILIHFTSITAIIEKKSSGQALMDIVARYLIDAGINPFRRMFNRMVSDVDNAPAIARAEVLKDSDRVDCMDDLYVKYKKYFGFNTTGQTRPILYGQVLQSASGSCGHLIKDKKLIVQLLALVKINGRIDHPKGGHDDLVIAWLLGHWLAMFGQNLSWYGINPGAVQSLVSTHGTTMSDEELEEKRFKDKLVERINSLKEKLMSTTNVVLQKNINQQIDVLVDTLGDEQMKAKIMDELITLHKEKSQKARTLSAALKRG